uniref:Zinc finger MYND domain-containing protein 10 n=1 Tax=Eptatretus burgeri TaxID=7764 RepID=A0A8C4NFT1_EPTBU
MANRPQTILTVPEAECIMQSIQRFPLIDIGSPRWMRQHEYIEKLNMQAALNASVKEEEFVKELLISYNGLPILIHDLLSTELWKHKIFPILCRLQDFKPKATFPFYIVIMHEGTIVNMLHTTFFHKDVCVAAEEVMLDVIEYCHGKLIRLIAGEQLKEPQTPSTSARTCENTPMELELRKQSDEIDFYIAMGTIAIIHCITNHLDSLPLSVSTHLLNTHNIPIILVQLLEQRPWSRILKSGVMEDYIEGSWKTVPPSDCQRVNKIAGQVWLSLINLLLPADLQRKYNFSGYNKRQLLKLRGHFTEVLLDQLPVLSELQRFLTQLALLDPPPPRSYLLLEQVPDIRECIVKENAGKWKAIAKHQVKCFFTLTNEEIQEQAQRLSEIYNLDVLEEFATGKPKCASCGAEGMKRCSRCRTEWYCCRECQVKHWPRHKQACGMITDAQGDPPGNEGNSNTKLH